MSRVAIIGSCITRDLWALEGGGPQDLLYISRTSLPSLFSRPVSGVEPADDPPSALRRHQHNAVVSDLKKLALPMLIAHRPTHIIFDFIDERFDLLATGGALATYSWELEVSGYRHGGELSDARRIPRLSQACERLWLDGLRETAAFLAGTPLRDACVILHTARWADRYRTAKGQMRDLPDESWIWEGQPALRSDHNALLGRYEDFFFEEASAARVVSAPDRQIADEAHRWGLSPFHYVPEYYAEIWRQLAALGV